MKETTRVPLTPEQERDALATALADANQQLREAEMRANVATMTTAKLISALVDCEREELLPQLLALKTTAEVMRWGIERVRYMDSEMCRTKTAVGILLANHGPSISITKQDFDAMRTRWLGVNTEVGDDDTLHVRLIAHGEKHA